MVERMSWLALGVAWTVLVSSGAADVQAQIAQDKPLLELLEQTVTR